MKRDRILAFFSILLLCGGIGAIGWVLFKSYSLKKELEREGELSCVSDRLAKKMNDDSMLNLVPQGSSFKVLSDYYRCNPVKRGDLVYFKFSAPVPAVVRKVYALPGDQFAVETGDGPKTFRLIINGNEVSTSGGKMPFKHENVPPLKSFEIARQGVLGPNEFIVLGEKQPSPNDSISLGAVKLSAFEGRIQR